MIGFAQNQYKLEESGSPYQLIIEVLSPPQSLTSSVRLIATATDGTATSKLLPGASHSSVTMYLFVGGFDYLVETGPSSEKTLTRVNQQSNYTISLLADGIVLEEEEAFSLQLQQTGGLQPVAVFQNTAITIVDRDGKCD